MSRTIDRRQMLRGAALAGGGMALTAYMPAWAQPVSGGIVKPLPTVSGTDIALTIDSFRLPVDGKSTPAIGVNGTVPVERLSICAAICPRLPPARVWRASNRPKLRPLWRRGCRAGPRNMRATPLPRVDSTYTPAVPTGP